MNSAPEARADRNFWLLVGDAGLLSIGTVCFDPNVVLTVFVAQFTTSPLLIGAPAALRLAGLYLPQLPTALGIRHFQHVKGFLVWQAVFGRAALLVSLPAALLAGQMGATLYWRLSWWPTAFLRLPTAPRRWPGWTSSAMPSTRACAAPCSASVNSWAASARSAQGWPCTGRRVFSGLAYTANAPSLLVPVAGGLLLNAGGYGPLLTVAMLGGLARRCPAGG